MADSELKLPGDFEAGKVYRLKGSTLIAWRAALLADRIIAGENLQEIGTPQGRILKAKPGGGSDTCGGFKLTNTGTQIKIAAGQAGSEIIAETTRAYGTDIYVRVTLTGTTGSYSAAISTTYSATDTVASVYIGSSDAEGVITQVHCGLISVQVCRNYYAAESPYYGMTVA